MLKRESSGRTLAVMITLLVLGVLVMTIDVRSQGGGLVSALRTGTQTLVAPLQKATAFAVTPVVDLVESMSNVANLREENLALRRALLEAEAELQSFQDLVVRVELFEQIFDLRAAGVDIGSTVANVIGRPDSIDGGLIIDKGSNHGIAVNQPVLDSLGYVVGTVRSVTRWNATIVPITTNRQGLTVIIGDQQGSLMTQTGSSLMRFESLLAQEGVSAGDRVLTSAGSLRFPAGLAVGEVVESANPTLDGLSTTVRPFVNPDILRLVVVLAWPPDPVSAVTGGTTTTTSSTTTTIPGPETSTTLAGDET